MKNYVLIWCTCSCLVFRKTKDLYLIITQKLIILKSGGFHADFTWNLVDFMKSLVIAPTLHSSNWRVFAETLAFIILGGFHRWNLGEIHQISWVKSTRFQGEICQISRVKSPTLHSSNWSVFAETLAFIILGGFHRWNLGEIHQISGWNLLDFKGEIPHPAFIKLKSFCWNTCFYNFGWISQVISGWNPPDFTGEIRRISKDQLPGMVSPMFTRVSRPASMSYEEYERCCGGPGDNSVLWNAMIHPLLNLTITGVIWYQGNFIVYWAINFKYR